MAHSQRETNDLQIQEEAPDVKTVKRESPNPEIKKITEKFDHVFQGMGKIRDKKDNEDRQTDSLFSKI